MAEVRAPEVRVAEVRLYQGGSAQVRPRLRVPRPPLVPHPHALPHYREMLFVGHCCARHYRMRDARAGPAIRRGSFLTDPARAVSSV